MSLINLSRSSCKSCYKCVNSCAVKAIRMKNEQAEIVEEKCISCGNCLVVCPQRARSIENDVKYVKQAIRNGKRVVASIAPSFPGALKFHNEGTLVAALKKLGFAHVEETAIGADFVSELYKKEFETGKYKNFITTACPSTNYLIEKYYPSLVKYMVPVVSPMVAHGKLIKQHYGEDSYVVFIGPCIAKKDEACEPENLGAIDQVITFRELSNWIDEEIDDVSTLSELDFDRRSYRRGSAYPLLGGVVESFTKKSSDNFYEIIKVDGIQECMELFQSMENGDLNRVCIEANVCKGGCIGGPSMTISRTGFYKRQQMVKNYVKSKIDMISSCIYTFQEGGMYYRKFLDKSLNLPEPTEEQLSAILRKMGKFEPEDELNCGGCGYNSCRENATAVFQGMSDIPLCLPYIRSKAESLQNVIFKNSPNITLILDCELNVLELNPKGEEIFGVKSQDIKNKPISYFLNDEDFRRVKDTKQNLISRKVFFEKYNVTMLENILYLEKEDIILAIMNNITEEEKNKLELRHVKENTIDAAQTVIDKQMRVAQEIASLLGETTAETKVILTKLKEISKEEIGDNQ